MGNYTAQDLENIKELKIKLDNKEITTSDVPTEYIKGLCLLYDKQIEESEKKIIKLREEKEEYRRRMEEAIEYLKNKEG